MAINGTPGGAFQAMQQGSQAGTSNGADQGMGQGFDPNQDPYNLAAVGQMAGQQQQPGTGPWRWDLIA